MGTNRGAEIDAWLRQGGVVIAASERAARAAMRGYADARRAEGLSAWPAPRIQDWGAFVRAEWEARRADGRLLLNSEQEAAVWRTAMESSPLSGALLPASARRLAALAASAHELLADYAPRYLAARARTEWHLDPGEFSRWLARFDEICRDEDLVSSARVPGEFLAWLRKDQSPRPPLLLVGFDRVSPIQKAVFDAWGEARQVALSPVSAEPVFYASPDSAAELSACAKWAQRQIASDASQRVMVIASDVQQWRGQLERSFLDAGLGDQIEFSLGVPLASIGVVRSALHTLDLLTTSLSESKLDWLISSGYLAKTPATIAALQRVMRNIRRAGSERTDWNLSAFSRRAARHADAAGAEARAWCSRMAEAQNLVAKHSDERNPLDWATHAMRVLQLAGWPGSNSISSAEHQAIDRFEQQVELCGSVGFDDSRMPWQQFLHLLSQVTAETLFSAETESMRVLIAGPSESAGLEADAIWLLGATEDNWPARGNMHPFLPSWLQREAEMPHASAQLDRRLSQSTLSRLMHSAPVVCFSSPRQADGIDERPSRMVKELAGAPQSLPAELQDLPRTMPHLERVEDVDRVPLSVSRASLTATSATITMQSQCPFKAFATTRLGAATWAAASMGLSPAIRGKLIHHTLASVWSGVPRGIRTASELRAISDLPSFVAPHAKEAMERIPAEVRSLMPAPYLELEERRLIALVSDWLAYERGRADFAVESVEHEAEPSIGGLALKIRLDRVDRLNDGSALVIDYKTGTVTPRAWDPPRPDDLQLPLYGEFGLDGNGELGGIAFAKLRAGDVCLAGRIAEPENTIGKLPNITSLKRSKLTTALLSEWRDTIEVMARDFVEGRAVVDPRDAPSTCERCGLQSVCRVTQAEADEDEADGASA